MTTPIAELERLFGPQFDLVEISGGDLSYIYSPYPEEPELRHVRREELQSLANQVRVLSPAYRPNSILPNLGPANSSSPEIVPPNNVIPGLD